MGGHNQGMGKTTNHWKRVSNCEQKVGGRFVKKGSQIHKGKEKKRKDHKLSSRGERREKATNQED